MTLSSRSWSLLWIAVLSVAAVAIFWPGLRSGYYADDFSYYFYPLPSNIFHYFTHENPSRVMYRPVFSTFLVWVQSVWGLESLPIHLTSLFCHVWLCWLVASSLVRLGYSRLQGKIGSAFFLVAQINTYTVLGNDTLSQVAGVLFGCLAAWLLYFPGRERRRDSTVVPAEPRWFKGDASLFYYLAALICFAVSLLNKETSTAYLGVIAVALLAANLEKRPRREAFVDTVLQLLPFVAVVATYMIIRSLFVMEAPQIGDGRYGMNLGWNIPKNIALFLTASATSLSSVTAFVALHKRDIPMLIAIGLTSLLFVAMVVRGLWIARHDRPVWTFLLLYFTCFFPIILFNHVSEVYIYNSFPFLAALVGIGLGGLYQNTKGSRVRLALGVAMVSLLALNIVSVQSKARMIHANGERALELLEQLRPFALAAPANSAIYMLNPPNPEIEYSAYVMNDFNILIAGSPGMEGYLGRSDIRMEVRNQADLDTGLRESDSTMILTIDSGRVVRYRPGLAR